LIQRIAYINLIQGGTIDIAISPQQATISALLGHVRKGDVANVVSLRHGLAEALEIIIHGEESSSHVIGRMVNELKMPTGAVIGAILRGNDVLIGDSRTVIQAGGSGKSTTIKGGEVIPTNRIFYLNKNCYLCVKSL